MGGDIEVKTLDLTILVRHLEGPCELISISRIADLAVKSDAILYGGPGNRSLVIESDRQVQAGDGPMIIAADLQGLVGPIAFHQ